MNDRVLEKEEKLYLISLDDPNVEELKIQLTTIHGDPDVYVSFEKQDNPRYMFEKRSINGGFFPDIVTFKSSPGHTLNKTYYVTVYGEDESEYKIEYFTKNENGTVQVRGLIEGEKSQGVLEINTTEAAMHPMDVPSLVYHFKVPTDLLVNEQELQIRLDVLEGQFFYLVQREQVPEALWNNN